MPNTHTIKILNKPAPGLIQTTVTTNIAIALGYLLVDIERINELLNKQTINFHSVNLVSATIRQRADYLTQQAQRAIEAKGGV